MSDPFRPRIGVVLNPAAPARPPEPAEFGAPVGGRVRFITWLCVAVIAGAMVLDVALAFGLHLPVKSRWAMVLAPLAGVLVVVPVFLFSQVLGYRVGGGELAAVRRGRLTRFKLDGLQGVEVDPEAMKFSVKIFGNDGAGAITGRFRNLRLGAYEALVTDRARSVVLRWPDRCLVVSPDRPAEFAAAVRAHAGLAT